MQLTSVTVRERKQPRYTKDLRRAGYHADDSESVNLADVIRRPGEPNDNEKPPLVDDQGVRDVGRPRLEAHLVTIEQGISERWLNQGTVLLVEEELPRRVRHEVGQVLSLLKLSQGAPVDQEINEILDVLSRRVFELVAAS